VDKTANKNTTQIYVVPLGGGEMRQLTNERAFFSVAALVAGR